jgi:hypothetical protein
MTASAGGIPGWVPETVGWLRFGNAAEMSDAEIRTLGSDEIASAGSWFAGVLAMDDSTGWNTLDEETGRSGSSDGRIGNAGRIGGAAGGTSADGSCPPYAAGADGSCPACAAGDSRGVGAGGPLCVVDGNCVAWAAGGIRPGVADG